MKTISSRLGVFASRIVLVALVLCSGAIATCNASSSETCRAAQPAANGIADGDDSSERIVPLKEVDVRPEFPGGRKAMSEYAEKHFAGDCIKDDPKCPFYVHVRFVVEKDGSVTGARLVENYSEKIENAVLGMLMSMPRWTPGQKDGEVVRTGYGTWVGVPEYIADSYTKPEFVGGVELLLKYLAVELKKYDISQYRGKPVRVLARFVVDTDGSIDDVEIVKPGHKLMNDAVVAVLKGMPKWKPGTIDGKPVRVRYTLPVRFGKD